MKTTGWWLLDYAREGAGKGLTKPPTIKLSERFGVVYAKIMPLEYYKGPFSKRDVERSKDYLEKVWGATL